MEVMPKKKIPVNSYFIFIFKIGNFETYVPKKYRKSSILFIFSIWDFSGPSLGFKLYDRL